MSQPNDLSRSLAALEQESTLIAVIEMSQSSWLVAGIVPGIERHPSKRLKPDEGALLRLLQGWRDEAVRAGRTVMRIAVAFEAGRDGFWLARWLGARGIEAHVIHPTSVAVSRDHRRAKTDRLDAELLKRAFLGWLRGERDHCRMAAVPTLEAEDARRPGRERDSLVGERTRIVNGAGPFSPRPATPSRSVRMAGCWWPAGSTIRASGFGILALRSPPARSLSVRPLPGRTPADGGAAQLSGRRAPPLAGRPVRFPGAAVRPRAALRRRPEFQIIGWIPCSSRMTQGPPADARLPAERPGRGGELLLVR